MLAILCSITLCQDITLLHSLSLVADRTEVDGHVLVGTTELRYAVFLERWLEAYEFLVLGSVVEDTDCGSVNIFDNAFALGSDHST